LQGQNNYNTLQSNKGLSTMWCYCKCSTSSDEKFKSNQHEEAKLQALLWAIASKA